MGQNNESELNAQPEVAANSVQSLRKQGYKVRINHYRYSYPSPFKKNILVCLPRFLLKGDDIIPHGGITTADIIDPLGKRYIGVSKCNLTDPYNKKTGVRRAIENALLK